MRNLTVKEISDAVGGRIAGNPDAAVTSISTDSRKTCIDDIFVALKGEKFDGNDFLEGLDGRVGAALCTRHADVSYPIIIVDDTLDALGRMSRYYSGKMINTKINVALTGSVGKTTTKEMTAAVLSSQFKTAFTQGNFNNHIGVPLTLLSVSEDDEALVCEMGMNHKGELAHLTSLMSSDIAMITNIGHSHIENLGSREGIRDAKLEILGGLKKDGTLIVNGDEPLLREPPFSGRIVRVGLERDNDLCAENIKMTEDSITYELTAFGEKREIRLPCTGRHNAVNSLFAIAVGIISGIDLDRIQSGLLNYRSVGLRQNIYVKNGVKVIADCYNAGVESMSASLSLLSELPCTGKRIAVLADMLELGDIAEEAHSGVGKRAAECGIDIVLTFGEMSRNISQAAEALGACVRHFEGKEELSRHLCSILSEEDTVLFKASHSMRLEEVIHLSGLEK